MYVPSVRNDLVRHHSELRAAMRQNLQRES